MSETIRPPIGIAALRPGDDLTRLGDWLADPRIARGLNIAPRRLPPADLRRYVESFDGRSGVILAIRAGEELVGVSTLDLVPRHRTAQWSLIVGARERRDKASLLDVGLLTFDWAFGQTGLDKVSSRIASRKSVLKRLLDEIGIRLEGRLRDEILLADGAGRQDELVYGLLRSEWPALRARIVAIRSQL